MTTRQIAYRLKAEGKTELRRDQQEVAQGFKETYAAAEQGAVQATVAADRLEKRYRAMAQAAQDSAQAQASQARFNAMLGVRESARGSAAASASVFMQDDADVRRVEALRAALDPAAAAQNKLNHELKEYQTLANAGKITTAELAQLQGQARVRYDETTAAIARNEKGLTRLALASRLNLTRQASDVLVTAAMGMNPAMIAIQQGPQILDALATSGFKASAGMIAAGTALTAAAAGVVLLGVAWTQGQAAAAAYQDAATGVGRTAGLTADQLKTLTIAAAESGEISRKAAREMAAEYLATGQIGKEVLGGLISITRDYASFTGTDAEAATKSLAKAMQDPKSAAHAMTEQFGLLSQAQLRDIDNMIEQGNQLAAQKVLLDELTGAVSGHADRAGEITDAWNAIGRSISDALDRLGEFLYATEDERISNLQQLLSSRSLNPSDRRRFEGELWVAERQKGIREMLDAGVAEEAAENAQAERRRVAAERRERAGRGAASRARAAAAREAREAERERKEALQRARREEDRASTLDLEVARARQNYPEVQRLEDANAVRMRERQLIDDGVNAEKAKTTALKEQERLVAARTASQQRELFDQNKSLDLEIMKIAGEERFAKKVEDRLALTKRIAALEKLGVDNGTAKNQAATELRDLEEARALALERSLAVREREWKMTLATASGDRNALRGLERSDWIERQARQIESDRKLNFGEGRDQAESEYRDLMRAQTVGGIREGMGDFLSDFRRSGSLREAVVEQLFDAGERWLDRLFVMAGKMDWSQFFKGGSDGAGGSNMIAKGLNFLFGRQNANGTDFWTGGPTWVGERGPELLDLPRGSRITEANRSLSQIKAAAGAGSAGQSMAFTYAPVITVDSDNAAEIRAMLAQQEADFRSKVVAVVKDASSRFELS